MGNKKVIAKKQLFRKFCSFSQVITVCRKTHATFFCSLIGLGAKTLLECNSLLLEFCEFNEIMHTRIYMKFLDTGTQTDTWIKEGLFLTIDNHKTSILLIKMPLHENKRDVVESMPIFYPFSINIKTDLEWHN